MNKYQHDPIFNKTNMKNLHEVEYMRSDSPLSGSGVYFNWINTDFNSMHSHSHWEIFVISDGSIYHKINGITYLMEEGDACIIRPSDCHKLYFQNEHRSCQHINFLIKNEVMRDFLKIYAEDYYDKLLNDENICSFKISPSELGDLISTCLNIQVFQSRFIDEAVLQCKTLVNGLINVFVKNRIPHLDAFPKWLNTLIATLNSPESFTMSLDEITKLTPYSYSRLEHVFKEYTNTTMSAFRNQIKIEHAKKLLQQTKETTLSISLTLGFNSLSHFNHLFKKSERMTPSEYRNALKPKLI